jgi:hypothetical protein
MHFPFYLDDESLLEIDLTELDVVGIGREGLPTLDVTSGLKTLY